MQKENPKHNQQSLDQMQKIKNKCLQPLWQIPSHLKNPENWYEELVISELPVGGGGKDVY